MVRNFQPQNASKYKRLGGPRPTLVAYIKKCTLVTTCFLHYVKQAICHLESTNILKIMIAFCKSAKNFRRDYNIYFLIILIFNLPVFWKLSWLSAMNLLLVICKSGFDSSRDTCCLSLSIYLYIYIYIYIYIAFA